MIDPTNITNYDLTVPQLQEHLLFWVFAAGHNALSTARGVDKFLRQVAEECEGETYFHRILQIESNLGWECVVEMLSCSGLGCWDKKSRSVYELSHGSLDLRECSVDDLESVYGIGPKTARCFLLHSRRGMRFAGLDTHMLKFLRARGVAVPNSKNFRPTGRRYKALEAEVLRICDEEGRDPAEFDLAVWREYSGNDT